MHTRPLVSVVLLALLLASPFALAAQLEQQRSMFLAAERALQRDALGEFAKLEARLRDYPLHPYLVHAALSKRLDRASAREVRKFLDTYSATPLAWQLRNAWLDRLAKEKRWPEYVEFYVPTDNVARRCGYLQALMQTGRTKDALPDVTDIWLQGKSQPDACDPVFAVWTKAGLRTPQRIWQRIAMAMYAGQWQLAEYLERDLSKNDRDWVERWIALYKAPATISDLQPFSKPHPYREAMLAHGVRRLARSDTMEALRQWRNVSAQFDFSDTEKRRTEHYIARRLVREPDNDAYAFLGTITPGEKDEEVHEARVRAALMREDWAQVVEWIDAMPAAQRNGFDWQYWRARALEATGKVDEARAIYAVVARDRGYYGFLAADRIAAEYHLAHAPTPVGAELLEQVARIDAVRRAHELFALDRSIDARREWRVATQGMDVKHLQAAAKLAEQYGWHDRAIFTLAKTGYWDDLELRFPLQHADLVEQNAERHGIDNAWIFAVMRQESAFMRNAHSHAGAIGLMQLMPATARSVARQILKRQPPRRSELLDPDTNIALGSAYLSQMKGRLGDSAVLATAAYNAGPHRVTRWLPPHTLPADIWIELVPFNETRGYLQRVLTYTVIYEKRMGRNPTRLQDRLHPVPPDLSRLGAAGKPASSSDAAG
ncbi:MAG: transglycosylase SLT domain-containing protein [Gammaproteobacteria bacterium]|nr:transglycosylase SLT domain-containing protein [Gammaproteobacteria bacterium]